MNILLLLYQLCLLLTICSCDCGAPGRQSVAQIYNLKARYEEGEIILYFCEKDYTLVDGTIKRECVSRRWSGEVPRCAKRIHSHSDFSRLKYENFKISYLDEEGVSYHTEISNLSQILTDSGHSSYRCLPLNESNHIELKITLSYPTRISAMELYYSNRNQTQNVLGYFPKIKGFINSYRNCSQDFVSSTFSATYHDRRRESFLCDVMKQEDYKEEKSNLPNSVTFEFKSEDPLLISICQVNLYQIPDECGQPDLPLYTSLKMEKRRNSSSSSSKLIGDDRYKIIGNIEYECVGDGKWFPTSPIIQPNISCVIPGLSINQSDYSIQISKLDYFNETMVAPIDTKLIYTCLDKSINKIDQLNQTDLDEPQMPSDKSNDDDDLTINERNQTNSGEHEFVSSKISYIARQFIRYCDENGQWIGPSPDCTEEKNKTNLTQPTGIKNEGNIFITTLTPEYVEERNKTTWTQPIGVKNEGNVIIIRLFSLITLFVSIGYSYLLPIKF